MYSVACLPFRVLKEILPADCNAVLARCKAGTESPPVLTLSIPFVALNVFFQPVLLAICMSAYQRATAAVEISFVSNQASKALSSSIYLIVSLSIYKSFQEAGRSYTTGSLFYTSSEFINTSSSFCSCAVRLSSTSPVCGSMLSGICSASMSV